MIVGYKSFINRPCILTNDVSKFISLVECDHGRNQSQPTMWFHKSTENELIGQTITCEKCGVSQIITQEDIR